MTPGLTLNYGLRWEPKLPESLTQEIVMNFSEERRAAGFQSSVFLNAPNGFTYPGDAEFEGTSGQSKAWGRFLAQVRFRLGCVRRRADFGPGLGWNQS